MIFLIFVHFLLYALVDRRRISYLFYKSVIKQYFFLVLTVFSPRILRYDSYSLSGLSTFTYEDPACSFHSLRRETHVKRSQHQPCGTHPRREDARL